MKIAIDLNDVIREFFDKFHGTYCAIYDINEDDFPFPELKTTNLLEYYGKEKNPEFGMFESETDVNSFMYVEAAMELHANSERVDKTIWGALTLFCPEINDEGHELFITSREFGTSVPATYKFLSNGCPIDKVIFEKATDKIWEHFDVIITANPKLIELKPEGKCVFKITKPYNSDVEADFEYKSLLEIIGNPDGFLKEIESKIEE